MAKEEAPKVEAPKVDAVKTETTGNIQPVEETHASVFLDNDRFSFELVNVPPELNTHEFNMKAISWYSFLGAGTYTDDNGVTVKVTTKKQ